MGMGAGSIQRLVTRNFSRLSNIEVSRFKKHLFLNRIKIKNSIPGHIVMKLQNAKD